MKEILDIQHEIEHGNQCSDAAAITAAAAGTTPMCLLLSQATQK
jgi:hypothetical protein